MSFKLSCPACKNGYFTEKKTFEVTGNSFVNGETEGTLEFKKGNNPPRLSKVELVCDKCGAVIDIKKSCAAGKVVLKDLIMSFF